MKKISHKKLDFSSKNILLVTLSVLQIVFAVYLLKVTSVGAQGGLERVREYAAINQIPYRNVTK